MRSAEPAAQEKVPMNGESPAPDEGEKTVVDTSATERIAVPESDARGADAPTRILSGREDATQVQADPAAQEATRILPRQEPATVIIDRGEGDSGAGAATRMLDRSGSGAAGSSPAPQTHVSMPHSKLPPGPAATSVSIAAAPAPVMQVPGPRTGQSATPSSARTAGSAADRDELPKTGEFIKERFELVQELG